jgi:electron transport complex protein RnfC
MITEYSHYLEPKMVYIPITDDQYKIANVAVAGGDTVKIGQVLAHKYQGKRKLPVISTISGKLVKIVEKMDLFGKLVDHVVIENDNQYALTDMPSYKDEVSTTEVRQAIERSGLFNVDVDGLFTSLDFDKPIKHIVVSTVFVNEPFVSTNYEYLLNNASDIVDGIALLAKAAATNDVTIVADKFLPSEVVDELGKAIVDKDLEEPIFVDTKKVKGWDYKVIQDVTKEKLAPNLLKNGVLYVHANTCNMVYDVVRRGLPVVSRNIALTGDGLHKNAVLNVRIGTLLSEIVEDLGGYIEHQELNLHIGNYLTGVQLPSDDIALTYNVDAIHISTYDEIEEDVCIKCGECNDVCPAGILPQNIMDAELRAVGERIFDLHTDECVECGLCTYVCPSKINVLEWVRRAKRRVG